MCDCMCVIVLSSPARACIQQRRTRTQVAYHGYSHCHEAKNKLGDGRWEGVSEREVPSAREPHMMCQTTITTTTTTIAIAITLSGMLITSRLKRCTQSEFLPMLRCGSGGGCFGSPSSHVLTM